MSKVLKPVGLAVSNDDCLKVVMVRPVAVSKHKHTQMVMVQVFWVFVHDIQ